MSSMYPDHCLQPIVLPESTDPEVMVNALIDEGFDESVARSAIDQRVR